QKGESIHKRFFTAACPDPDELLATEQADRIDLVEQATRVLLEIGTVEPNQRKGIGKIDAASGRDLAGALGDEPTVGPIDQEETIVPERTLQKGVEFVRFDVAHSATPARYRSAAERRGDIGPDDLGKLLRRALF